MLTSNDVENTKEHFGGKYSWPSNPRWSFHSTAPSREIQDHSSGAIVCAGRAFYEWWNVKALACVKGGEAPDSNAALIAALTDMGVADTINIINNNKHYPIK